MGHAVAMYGASVRGPRNRREGHPNQDAWGGYAGAFGHLIVVCDGLGSRPAADRGARAACLAVRRAVRHWPGTESGAEPSHLVRLVEILWRLELAPRRLAECATTCLFALREGDGTVLAAGLGDGLAIVRGGDGQLRSLGGRRAADFGNETIGLGTAHQIADWWIDAAPTGATALVLATDGVADDLDPHRLDAFVRWAVDDIGALTPTERWRHLCRELRAWPVPHHVDDKTIAVLDVSQERPR